MAHYGPQEWWYPTGDPAAGVPAIVFEGTVPTLASIFSDSGLSVPLANPTTTDGSGMLEFYAADGDYWIYVGSDSAGDSVLVTLGPGVTGAVTSVNGQGGVVVLGAADVGAQPIATIDAKGDLYVGTGADATTRLPAGADGQVLTADSAQASGLKWDAAAAGGVTSVNGDMGPAVVLDATEVGALAIANNLSDVASASTSRTSLGLGTAATHDTGTGATQVILGNDARLTDARTPTAHATTHASAGSDPVTLAESQITNLVADLAGKQPLDSDLTQIAALTPTNDDIVQRKAGAWANRTIAQLKTDLAYTAAGLGALQVASNLSDVASASTSRTNLGLGDSATKNVGTAAGTVAAGDDSRITGAAQKASNLSDLASASTSRTNLGLGTAATKDTGTGATQVILGNDARLTDARTPTAHASTHASAGSDPVTLAQSQITSLVSDLAAKQPLDSDLTTIAALTPTNDDVMQYKAGAWANRTIAQLKTDLAYTAAGLGALVAANNLSDVANASTSRTNLGLGGAAVLSVGTTAGTVAAGDDSRITGAAQKASNLSDLASASTSRTNLGLGGAAVLGVGTTAGTVAAGDDSRITGAQQKSTLTTKGDLYVATASATSARQGVGSDGQVLTADSAQTNGIKWAAYTDTGAVPKSTVTTKGDLIVATASATVARQAVGTDGQVLSADSTQTNGVKWIAAAVDPGAQAKSTLTTKGDLYIATASATTTRQAAGANGLHLVADSTVTNGVKYAIPPSLGIYPRSTGYSPTGGVVVVRSSKAATADTMYLIPFYLLVGATTSGLAFEVSGAVALAVVRTGLYGSDSSMLPTGAAIVDNGQTASATTGTKTVAMSTALEPGLYWVAFVGQIAAPTVRQGGAFSPFVASATFPAGSGAGWNGCYVQTGASGTLPTIGSIADSDGPIVGIKF